MIKIINSRQSWQSRILHSLIKIFMGRHFARREDIMKVRRQFHAIKHPSRNYFLKRFSWLRIEEVAVGPSKVPCERVVDIRQTPVAKVIYFHGGAYVMGSTDTHRVIAVKLALRCKAEVVSVNYRLAPENVFPAAIEDALEVYQQILEEYQGPIFFGGDSAGGGLVMATLLAAKERNIRLPTGCFCFSPWLDLTMSGSSILENQKTDVLVGDSDMALFAKAYAGDVDAHHPLISPLFAELKGLPPLLLQVSSTEVLYADAVRFVEKAVASGVDAQLQVFKGQIHVFQAIPYVLPEAIKALELVREFIATHVSKK